MTKNQAAIHFELFVLPFLQKKEMVITKAWESFKDELYKSGEITKRQYETWLVPKIIF